MGTRSAGEALSGGAAGPGRAFLDLPELRFGVLGVEASLRTDSDLVRGFFAHAYRWFPPGPGASDLNLAAVFRPGDGVHPWASAGGTRLDLGGSRSPENRAFLFLLESLMDRISGSLVLHGAAVRDAETGIILAGPAMAGKSTLALELMRIGFGFLSDDAAPLERTTGRLLPFPRAVGVRRTGSTPSPPVGLPAEGVMALPHKWLVDPAALGARLPARPCRPGYLFYLEDEPIQRAARRERVFEIALAERDADLETALRALSPLSLDVVAERPFPSIRARFDAGVHPVTDLAAIWRRHRGAVLCIEEVRDVAVRSEGPPRIRRVGLSTLLLPLVRDLLNRGEDGRLMADHGGRLTSLVVELGSLLRDVACHRVAAGSPAATAEGIARWIRSDGGRS